MIYALLIGSLLMLSFLLFVQKKHTNVPANRWLLVFFLCAACLMGDSVMHDEIGYVRVPWFILLPNTAVFVLPVALYLSVAHFVSPEKTFSRRDFLHLIPALLLLASTFAELMANWADPGRMFEPADAPSSESKSYLSSFPLEIWYGLWYWGLSMRLLLKHRRAIRLLEASPADYELDWLRNLLLGILVLLLFWLLDDFFQFTALHSASTLVYLGGIFYAGYFAILQKEIFPYRKTDLPEIQQLLRSSPADASRPPLMAPEVLELQKNRLLALMEQEKPYLDNEINLPELARRLELRPQELSFLINTAFGENFYTFINRYRVECSKELLTLPKYAHLSMVGIAFEAGFNSKTTFNTVFKKMTGRTPSEFRDSTNKG